MAELLADRNNDRHRNFISNRVANSLDCMSIYVQLPDTEKIIPSLFSKHCPNAKENFGHLALVIGYSIKV